METIGVIWSNSEKYTCSVNQKPKVVVVVVAAAAAAAAVVHYITLHYITLLCLVPGLQQRGPARQYKCQR